MKKISTLLFAASATILVSFTIMSFASEKEQIAKPTSEELFGPRGGYTIEEH